MALSRELLKRLNSSEGEPLSKRLKLAETAFLAADLPLVQKEDSLLTWLCNTCTTDGSAWKTLNNCLKSPNVNVNANVKQRLIDTLMQTLSSDLSDIYEEVLECVSLVLASDTMRQYFANKPNYLGLLIKTLLNNVSEKNFDSRDAKQKEYNKSFFEPCKLSAAENDSVTSVIESLMQIYKQSITTKDELQLLFIRDILYPMCDLIDHERIDGTNKFGKAAYKCIQQLLLGKSKQSAQSKQITEDKSQEILSELFRTLSANAETSNPQRNLLSFQFIFRAAIGTYKSDAASLDAFFRNLVGSAGRCKWEILNALLKLLNDATLDFDNVVEGVTLSEYLQRIVGDALTRESLTRTHREILTQLSYLNPVLVERSTSEILSKILAEEETVDRTDLLIAILHASAKLRREQKFISQLLMSLKQLIAIRAHEINASAFFPREFSIKLTKVVGNFSNSQTNATLRTLMHHLNTDCAELLQSNASCKNILMLKTTVELLVILFDGVQTFENTRISSVERFISDLEELGNILSLLIDKALCLSHDKTIIVTLLSAVQSLSEVQSVSRYYLPKDATSKLLFPISDNPWQQLIQRITNFGENNCKNIMNKLILHRLKLNASNKPIKLRGLIGGLEYAWDAILRHDADVISLLNDKEISRVTYLLLDNMTSSKEKLCEWFDVLDKECVQENRIFVTYLLSHTLDQIGRCLSTESTESIAKCINGKLLLEDEANDELLGILRDTKERISRVAISPKIELHLEILLRLPTLYFGSNVRALIFLVVYTVSEMCETNDKVLALCNEIFSDLLEKPGIDIFQYVEPTVLLNQLPESKIFPKACEFFLRNVKTYATLKGLIKNCKRSKEAMCIILECIENMRLKVDAEQKVIFKKAEKKLIKDISRVLPEKINHSLDVRCLMAVLKVTIPTGEISDSLKSLTESTLRNVFAVNNDSSDASDSPLLEQGVQLIVIILRHRRLFEVEATTIKNLWLIMFRRPRQYLLEPLLASTEVKELYELLRVLYNKTIKGMVEADEATWTNLLVIWGAIIKASMGAKRNKIRLIGISHLFESLLLLVIPEKCWPELLRLSHDMIVAKYAIPDIMIDFIIILGTRSLMETKSLSCENVLLVCGALIKIKTDVITDRLSNLLSLYRNVVNVVVHASKSVADKFEEHRFRRLAFDIEKLTRLLVKLKKDMVRLSPYVIADFIQLIVEGTIPSYMKTALHNSLCQLLSICDQHGIAFLSRTLPPPLQEVFKTQLNMFKKFYKYSGKI